MKIEEILSHVKPREVPLVYADSEIDEVIRIMVRFPHTRLAYVVDDENRFVGTISLGSLLRHLFPYHYEGKVHPRGILRRITAEMARHLMDKQDIHATPDEQVDEVLERMASTGVKEMAVVDAGGYVVGDITAIDLLRWFHLKENGMPAKERQG